uniref:Uncharacterized protein n=1 Tax=Meloidogyne hapla TaxID=6305 RepID=A0A1I8BD06_MELHA
MLYLKSCILFSEENNENGNVGNGNVGEENVPGNGNVEANIPAPVNGEDVEDELPNATPYERDLFSLHEELADHMIVLKFRVTRIENIVSSAIIINNLQNVVAQAAPVSYSTHTNFYYCRTAPPLSYMRAYPFCLYI